MLSIDDKYDPEEGIEVKHFVMISRLVNYKDIFVRFLRKNKSSLKMEFIDKFKELVGPVTIHKET